MKYFDMSKSVFYEKYKPFFIEDLILPPDLKAKLAQDIKTQDIPNLGLFSILPGVGKSSCAHAIIKEINGEALWINASIDRSIDVLRGKIGKFASSSSFDGNIKIVVMDECLEENEEVRIGKKDNYVNIKLKELEFNKCYNCVSFNLKSGKLENDTCEVISNKYDEIYEIELEDGKIIKVTSNHPFIVEENGKYIEKSINDGLSEKDNIVCVKYFDILLKNIKSIKKIGKAKVINLTVHKNHTFITKNGIVTHNCDHFTKDGQAAFRGFCDEFSQNCRFIFTGNYKEKIIEPLLDRLEIYDFNIFSKEEMVKPIFERLKFILENEKITYEPKDLVPIINTYYPRIRSMIGALQKFSKNGIFKVNENELDDINAFDNVMKYVTKSTFNDMIIEINKLNAPTNMFSFLYKSAGKYFKPDQYPKVVLIIAKYQHMDSSVRDKHLNLSACLTELLMIKG